MKVLGADIVAFFESPWPEDYYVDDSVKSAYDGKIFEVGDNNSTNPLPLDDKYNLSDFGYLCFSGETGPTLASFFAKWKKERTMVTLLVDVPKEKEQEIREILKAEGVKVK